jgi:hypothetical protein
MEVIWTQTSNSATAGPGGGGGAAGAGFCYSPAVGANGSLYGGGGAGGAHDPECGGQFDGGSGAQGIVVITYTAQSGLVPDAPPNLTTSSVTGGVSLSWTAASSSPGVTSYGIYRDTVASSTTLLGVTTSTTTATYTDSTATRGIKYFYRVVAVNSVGTSTYSNEKVSGANSGRIIRLGGLIRAI